MTMTDTEAKALALELDRIANQIYAGDPTPIIVKAVLYIHSTIGAATRHAAELREQAERFSEVLVAIRRKTVPQRCHDAFDELAAPFIIPKPDPLVEVFDECFHQAVEEGETWSQAMARKTRAAMQARGGKIVWGEG